MIKFVTDAHIYLRICTDLRWFHDISIKAAINDQTRKTPQLSGYLVHSVRLKQLLMETKNNVYCKYHGFVFTQIPLKLLACSF